MRRTTNNFKVRFAPKLPLVTFWQSYNANDATHNERRKSCKFNVDSGHLDCELTMEIFQLQGKKTKKGNKGTKATASTETPSSNQPPAPAGGAVTEAVAAPAAVTNPAAKATASTETPPTETSSSNQPPAPAGGAATETLATPAAVTDPAVTPASAPAGATITEPEEVAASLAAVAILEKGEDSKAEPETPASASEAGAETDEDLAPLDGREQDMSAFTGNPEQLQQPSSQSPTTGEEIEETSASEEEGVGLEESQEEEGEEEDRNNPALGKSYLRHSRS
jgi:hypothetical protein